MAEPAAPSLPTRDDLFAAIRAAAAGLAGRSTITPVATSRALNRRLGASIFFKCENFQRAGAFKFRGAWNAISRLPRAARERGVITHSSGNHAQAVALAARLLGAPATIVMPSNAPAVKRAATEAYGARILAYDPERDNREQLAAGVAARESLALVPPFDHLDVIAGQGTVALELVEEIGELDLLLVPVGGGGLISGCATAAKSLLPGCRVVGVEPELADDATRSFRSRRLESVHNPATIADGTRVSSLGRLTFPLVLREVDAMVTVSEDAIREAVRHLALRMKLVVEPSGALGLAALVAGAVRPGGRTGVVLSGGNVDPGLLAEILASGGLRA